MTVREAIALYLESLDVAGYAARTIDTYEPHLEAFALWIEEAGLIDVADVRHDDLRRHRTDLMISVTRFGRPPSLSMQSQRIVAIRQLFDFLVRRSLLLVDPAANLEYPRVPRRGLPMGLPTPAEMMKVLAAPDTSTPAGVRDRAVLEVLYSTGLRNAELRAVRVWDVDLAEGTLAVVRGKGRKDRVVPMGRHACLWVRRYLDKVRPQLVRRKSEAALFLTSGGRPLHFTRLIKLVKSYVAKAGLNKNVTVHTFRHACATHMLQRGADIRYLQQLLGHRSLATTTMYTHLSIKDLQKVHQRCHPRSKPTDVARPSSRR